MSQTPLYSPPPAASGAPEEIAAGELYVAPTSFAQQRLWLVDRLAPGLATYNVPLLLRLSGPLQPAVLAAALQALVDRHESLRTAFGEEEGEPVQLIIPTLDFPLSRVDLPRPDPALALLQARREVERPFDLTRAPLLRAILFRLSAGEHLLLLTLHHIVTDASSLGILVRELFALYEAFRAGEPSSLPELPIQYADFAAWEREWLSGETLERKLLPWSRRLAGAPESLALPTDRPRRSGPRAGATASALLDFALPEDLGAALRGLARESGLTLFMAVLAGFSALLCRFTGQGDLVVGSPVANRTHRETEEVVGLFLNTLALRVEVGDDPSFRTLLARTREVVAEAFAHADVPFDKLVLELRPERRADQTPLFQVLLAFQQPTVPALPEGSLAVAPVEIHATAAKFDLVLHLVDGPVLAGGWEYPTDRFDRTTIGRLARHFAVLLADATAHLDRRLSELAVLPEAERHQLLVEWSGSDPALPVDGRSLRLHDLFTAQAARTPETLAVVSAVAGKAGDAGESSLTYRELQAQARALAQRLAALGVGPGSRVALSVGRHTGLAVAVLGILEAGGACVPLDPEYPRQRLELMLEDAGVEALLTEEAWRDRLPHPGIPVLLLDRPDADPAGSVAPGRAPSAGAGPDDLVYVLYTSGSTGRPKGVGMPHRALVNVILWQLAAPGGRGLPPGAPTAQLAPLSFDASFQEIFATWAAGGTLVLLPEEARREPAELLRRLAEQRVARLFLPFVALQQLATAAELLEEPPPFLREVVTAGEQLQITPQIRSFFHRLPGASLHNQYGPTEAHVVTALTLPPEPEPWPALPAIGRPIAGVRIFLLDPRGGGGDPVPAGVTGALHIGGVCLARGYQGRPELTAERFVPSPEGGRVGEPGDRLYHTGDLARCRADGTIEFLGRADQQVKIRGFRVEPAEVEAVLATHPGVAACVVAARLAAAGGLRLVAWVTVRTSPPSPQELRDFLAARLPDYLVPAALVEVASLPRTPSGKVDRAALPDPGPETASEAAGAARPLTPIEEVLAGIWVGILRVPKVSPDDNFFDLGGHSLTATTVTSQARQTFQVEIPARTLFESPTLSELASRIEALLLAREGLTLPPITPSDLSGDPAPLSFAQRRLWFLDELSGGASPFYNIAAALALDGPLDPGALAAAVRAIVRRHEALRTTFAAGPDGRPVQAIHPPALFPLPVVDLRALRTIPMAEATALRLAREEAARPFSLATGPLLRVGLVRLAAERHLLTLTLHHIVADGWSLDVFVRELAALYRPNGTSPGLPALPVQYADFARWQQRWLAGPVLDAQLAYWQGQLAGAPLVLALPTDRPRPALQTYPGANHPLHLPPALTAALHALAREHRVTLFMALLAPFAALLGRWAGQDDLLVGTPIANRTHREIEGLIGCFVNLLVLRADLSGDPEWRQLLARLREVALSAYAHQDLPFERLVEELQSGRDLSRNPLFQVSFSMGSTPWHELNLPGLALGHLPGLEAGPEVELFDLTLQIFETPFGLDVRLAWNTDLFDAATVGRMAGHFQALLAALAADPAGRLTAAEILSPAEREQLLAWAVTPVPVAVPGPASVLPGIAEQVRRQGAAPALLWADGELSYEELDRRANRLARRLAALGVGPERVVGLRLDGGADFATAVLAVWKAGGAYLPLDPRLPAERLAFLLADSGAVALVTRGRLEGAEALPTVRLDADRADLAALSALPLSGEPLSAMSQSAAYLIYTSGSTGRPKGVVVPHGALAVHALAFQRWLGLGPEDRVLQLAAFSFDVSVDELVPTLLAGAALVPWRPETPEPAGLARLLRAREVTVANLPTALWHQAARAWAAAGGEPWGTLRWVLVGGEAMPPGAAELWGRTPLGAVPLVNGYGLTETVITSTLYPLPAETPERESVPIGRPLAGRSLHLLDARGDLVPPGAVGEIHLGGEALARGYLGRPDLTAAAFVPDPWGLPGGRLYRTGDLARFRAGDAGDGGGDLELLGRRDQQVKVRGFRIEPAEVEAALLAHPRVAAAAVALRQGDGPEYGSLVAYVVSELPGPELRAFLAGRLPAYLLPAAWVSLPGLPLTASGKVDRRALAALAVPAPAAPATVTIAPPAPEPALPSPPAVDPAETLLTGIWREVLGDAAFGPEDNFFDLGGHSMLLSIVRVRLQQALGTDLSMIDLFEHPTIAALARRLRQEVGDRLPAPAATPATTPEPPTSADIAVIGMGGRFPGARDVEQLWRNLRDGVESISFFLPGGEAAWQRDGSRESQGGTFHVPAGGVVEGIDLWDAAFFGVDDREAELMDPQHRLFLECAWEVLEDAGYDTERYPGRIGVFGGATKDDYRILLADLGILGEMASSQLAAKGNEKDFLTTRVSAKLDLTGPSLSLQLACATSLVATHLACRSLLAGECDMALAGGVSLACPSARGYYHQPGGYLSSDGHCRSFDARGDGSADSDGVGLVVLKRLADAVADGDRIHAVLRGTGVNNDGAVARIASRAELIRQILERAAIPPDSITYVEANGNGTQLSDASEVAALTAAFRSGTERRGFCALGSVKTNLGYPQAASGVTALIKVVLSLEHRQIPPSLHFERPNPAIDFAASPFYVNTRLRDWESAGDPRRAGVSAFGTGGTNAHVVVEEAPPRPAPAPAAHPWQLLVLSAKTASALSAATERLAAHLAAHPDLHLPDLADVAWTLQVGRRAFEHRRAVLCRDLDEAIAALRSGDPARVWTGTALRRNWRAAEDPVRLVRSAAATGTPEELAAALAALGRLWVAGAEIDWPALHAGERRLRTPLPTYPFERRRYWVPGAPGVPGTIPSLPETHPVEEAETAAAGA